MPPDRARRPNSGSVAPVHIVAGARLLLATLGVLAVDLAGGEARGDVLLVLGAGMVPASAALALVSTSTRPRTVAIVGALVDIAFLFVLQAIEPAAAPIAVIGGGAAAAVVAPTAGFRWSIAMGATALGSTAVAAQLFASPDRPATGVEVSFGLAAVLLILLVSRTSASAQRAEASSARSRGQAEAILARVADGVVVTDGRGVCRQANPAAARLLGADPTGSHCAVALQLHKGERPIDCSSGCAVLALVEMAADGVELWRPRQDGRRQPVLASADAVRDDAGAVVEVVHSIRDITAIRAADEAKTMFLATASHELKTPLTVIGGFAQTLLQRDDLPPAATRMALEAIERRAHELARIVDRLLLSSRIEAGRLAVEQVSLDVVALLGERIDSMAAATGRSIVLGVDGEPDHAVADPVAVVTVVDHLLENAVKYSPEGGDIDVVVRGDDGHVVVSVTDRGVGMDALQVQSCFEKFWQGESNDVRRFGGTGIGLYIVRSCMEAMGGDVRVDSVAGAGSTFTFRLPTEPPAAEASSDGREPSIVREFMRQIGIAPGQVVQ